MKAIVYTEYGVPDVLRLQKARDLGMPLLSVNFVNPGQAKTQGVKS